MFIEKKLYYKYDKQIYSILFPSASQVTSNFEESRLLIDDFFVNFGKIRPIMNGKIMISKLFNENDEYLKKYNMKYFAQIGVISSNFVYLN